MYLFMSNSRFGSVVKTITLLVVTLAVLQNFAAAQSTRATLHFTNKTTADAKIVQATPTVLRWSAYPDGNAITDTPHQNLVKVDFEPTEQWTKAESAFLKGKYTEAGQLFSVIARSKAAYFHPAPGNYSSQAIRRILSCHRFLLNGKKVAELSTQVKAEFQALPADQRAFTDVEQAWIAAGTEKWDEVLKATEKDRSQSKNPVELAYLSGRAHLALGDRERALDSFTEAYAFGLGTSPEITKNSLRASAEIVSRLGDEERLQELQSQLKIYQDLFGKGKLWEGASPQFVELANSELETIDFSMGDDEETGSGAEEAAPGKIVWKDGALFKGGNNQNLISLEGTLVEAINAGGKTAITLTIKNGKKEEKISFSPRTKLLGTDPEENEDPKTSDKNWNNIIKSFSRSKDSSGQLKLTGLTEGKRYQIEIFALDIRNPKVGQRTFNYADPGGAKSKTQKYSDGISVIGTFLADADTKVIEINTEARPLINAYMVRVLRK